MADLQLEQKQEDKESSTFTKKFMLLWDSAVIKVLIDILIKIIEDPENIQNQTLNYETVEKQTKDCTAALDILYDIGFKECIQHKTKQLKIEVTDDNLSHMKHICNQLTHELYNRPLVYRHAFDCKQLMKAHPPQFTGAKQLIFNKICPNAHDNCFGTMIYSRYKLASLPLIIANPTDFIANRLKIQSNIFEYTSNTKDRNTAHFYVNFADRNLFGFYRGSLFAQDEIMSTEHPILGSLREKLVTSYRDTKDKTKLIPKCEGAVVILNALKHGHFTQNNLYKIYGKKFRMATDTQVLECVDICEPPIVDNIICIAALMAKGRNKLYKKEQIQELLRTAYCGFNGAKCCLWSESFADKEEEEKSMDVIGKKVTVIHSGNWGCGAFGGNKELHVILQVIAAVAAGVDEIYYHAVNEQSMIQARNGCKMLMNEIYPKCKDKNGDINRDLLIEELMKKKFQWGKPNGT